VIGGSGCGKSTLLRATPASTHRRKLGAARDVTITRRTRRSHHLPGAAPAVVADRRRQCRLRHRRPAEAERANASPALERVGLSKRQMSGRANCPAGRRNASPSRALVPRRGTPDEFSALDAFTRVDRRITFNLWAELPT
jgi:ABC-type nitrate/sulfonate/bicarbonate transport system ATPase subunit